MKITVIHDRADFSPQIAFTFDVLLSEIGVAHEVLPWPVDDLEKVQRESRPLILYGSDALGAIRARRKLHIRSSAFFGPHYLKTASLPTTPLQWVAIDGKRLPVLYSATYPLIGQTLLVTQKEERAATRCQEDGGISIQANVDLIASSFFMLSRYEEYVIQTRDQFDRFPLEANLAFREGFWRTPIVNIYARLIGEWLETLTGGEVRPKPPDYPGAHRFGICLTHDVDNSKKFTPIGILKTAAKVALLRQRIKALGQIGTYLLTGEDPFWNFEQIFKVERAHGFRSTFFLSGGRRHRFDPPYGNDPQSRARLCEAVLGLGAEVGLHGSFESYASTEILGAELAALSQHTTVSGGRQHYLRLDAQRTFAAMEQVGLLYDCSLGFSREMGFRSGFAGPYHPFNLAENRPFRIVEIPLVAMDQALWSGCCQGMRPESIWEEMLLVLELVQDLHGCVSVLWHNGFFDDAAFPGYDSLYRTLLSWLEENDGWGAPAGAVYKWFSARRAE